MTGAPRPLCSRCGVALKEKRSALTFRQWCPQCGTFYVLYRAQPDSLPPFVIRWLEKRDSATISKMEAEP